MSFYIFLPSNVSPLYFPDNRISSFKVKLPKRFQFLPDEYEVALTELTYNHSMKTFLRDSDRLIRFRTLVSEREIFTGVLEPHWRDTYVLPNLNYSSIVTLCTELNKALQVESGKQITTFNYDSEVNRVSVNAEHSEIQLSSLLSNCLGFPDIIKFTGKNTATNPPDCFGSMYHMFVYCDFVQPQIVGDSLVPLLRIVDITGREGQTVTQTFRPYYLPISKLEFDTIEILLCNEYGEEIHFTKGISVVTVHFRKRSFKHNNGN